MSTTSKQRIVLFLMVAIALVFFIISFLATAFTDGANISTTSSNNDSQQAHSSSSSDAVINVRCMAVRTGEDKVFGECRYS